MRREVNLLEYLPEFLREYREFQYIAEAEKPEFEKCWDEIERSINNQFISTADSDGISRFEKMLKITPEENDNIESRRSRVLARWNDTIPYTWKIFLRKLDTLCGIGNYEVIPNFDKYELTIITHLDLYGQIDELETIIDYMLPANLQVNIRNEIIVEKSDSIHTTGIMTYCEEYEIR